jgi:hypothetical protein
VSTKQVWMAVFFVALGAHLFAQSGAVIPQGGAGHASQASCIILKRMGPADQVTSHMYSFGLRGKQFQYVEGKLPEGFPFHGRLTDHDVRNMQSRGAEVIVLDAHYTSDDLRQARSDCRGETGKSPNQSEPKPDPTSAQDVKPNLQPAAVNTPQMADIRSDVTSLAITSSPSSADIEVDGNFVGNTPSTVQLDAGDHAIKIDKSGYKSWEKNLRTKGGNVNINADLEPAPK